jgi:hypothetical protein
MAIYNTVRKGCEDHHSDQEVLASSGLVRRANPPIEQPLEQTVVITVKKEQKQAEKRQRKMVRLLFLASKIITWLFVVYVAWSFVQILL